MIDNDEDKPLTLIDKLKNRWYALPYVLHSWHVEWIRFYFKIWARFHPRIIHLLAEDERKKTLVVHMIHGQPEKAIMFTKTIAEFDEKQVEQLEEGLYMNLLRQSPLRNMMPRKSIL